MTLLEKLDIILNDISFAQEDYGGGNRSSILLKFRLKYNYDMQIPEYDFLIKILKERDGFIENLDFEKYKLTLKGKLFLEEEIGYCERNNKLILEASHKKNMEFQLLLLNFFVAFGTCGLLIWEVIKYCLEKYDCCH